MLTIDYVVGEDGLYERSIILFLLMTMLTMLRVVGGEGAIMEKEDSIKGMLKCLKGLKPEDSGKFFGHDGGEKDW